VRRCSPCSATPSRADDAASYPAQNIKIIVPFPAGGTADTPPQPLQEQAI
jgi:tripartite-type tricarboxylate transporter receptor subunit TctC